MIVFTLQAGDQSYEVHFTRTDYIAWVAIVVGHPELSVQGDTLDETFARLIDGFGPIKVGSGAIVSSTQVIGATISPTTTSSSDPMCAVIPEMTCTITPMSDTNRLRIHFTGTFSTSVANAIVSTALYVDGKEVAGTLRSTSGQSGSSVALAVEFWMTLAATAHLFEMRWRTSVGTVTAPNVSRALTVTEFST